MFVLLILLIWLILNFFRDMVFTKFFRNMGFTIATLDRGEGWVAPKPP